MQVKKYPHIFLFHGETALCKIIKFQEETANFSEKFQGEIAEFLRENMGLRRQNLKISGRNTGISWRKYWISLRNLEKFFIISPRKTLFLPGKTQLVVKKNKKWGFSSPALYVVHVQFSGEVRRSRKEHSKTYEP